MALLILFAVCLPDAYARDFHKDIIYQIVTDRFVDGDKSNDDPAASKGLFDPAHQNWHAYWGGDFAGITAKIDYLQSLGVGAVWISPPMDNTNKPVKDDAGSIVAPYHGYHARDFFLPEEHFGDWNAFDDMVGKLHKNSIKLVVDFPCNHSNQFDKGEFGELLRDGEPFISFTKDDKKCFHHNPQIANWDDPYQLQYYTIFDLADLAQENPQVDSYLTDAAERWQEHGADAFRLDAAKHINWDWMGPFAAKLKRNRDSFVCAEWWQTDTTNPLYKASCNFANKSEIAMIDFPLNTAIRHVFGKDNDVSFNEIADVIDRESRDMKFANNSVTFIDNHDMTRFLTLNPSKDRLHEALVLLVTSRGIPCILYGTEQYLHDDTGGGNDPYDRPMMSAFDTSTQACNLIKVLGALRKSNSAIAYGQTRTIRADKDVYLYERTFSDDMALVAINKNDDAAVSMEPFTVELPAQVYKDKLSGVLGGSDLKVVRAADGNTVMSLVLPPHSAMVWSYAAAK